MALTKMQKIGVIFIPGVIVKTLDVLLSLIYIPIYYSALETAPGFRPAQKLLVEIEASDKK